MSKIQLYNGDCLIEMNKIKDKSVDMILCDLPYGTTQNSWDSILPFDKLWGQYNRIIKDNGCIALFGAEPFSSQLRCSNLKNYKYDWVWKKGNQKTGHLNAHIRPLFCLENISIFNSKIYYPQGLKSYNRIKKRGNNGSNYNYSKPENYQEFTNYPSQLLNFDRDFPNYHPTQKPIALLQYLIKTYTNENELVLDNCMGSGSTGVACCSCNRNFIGIELDKGYFEIAEKRINEANTSIFDL